MFSARGNSSLVGENCRVSRMSGGRKESEAEASKPVAQTTAAMSSMREVCPDLSSISIVFEEEARMTFPVIVCIFLWRTNSV